MLSLMRHAARVLLIAAPLLAQPKGPIQLRGDRFPGLSYEQMTPEQKALTDRAQAAGGLIGSFNILLRSPELSEVVRGPAGNRTRSDLAPLHNELSIIVNARYWTTQFEWLVHRQAANRAGLSEAVTTAIAEGRLPQLGPNEQPVYDFVRELFVHTRVTDRTFAAARALVGDKGIVDIVGIVGFYQLTSMLMNTDRYPMNADQKPELKALAKTLPVFEGRFV